MGGRQKEKKRAKSYMCMGVCSMLVSRYSTHWACVECDCPLVLEMEMFEAGRCRASQVLIARIVNISQKYKLRGKYQPHDHMYLYMWTSRGTKLMRRMNMCITPPALSLFMLFLFARVIWKTNFSHLDTATELESSGAHTSHSRKRFHAEH